MKKERLAFRVIYYSNYSGKSKWDACCITHTYTANMNI